MKKIPMVIIVTVILSTAVDAVWPKRLSEDRLIHDIRWQDRRYSGTEAWCLGQAPRGTVMISSHRPEGGIITGSAGKVLVQGVTITQNEDGLCGAAVEFMENGELIVGQTRIDKTEYFVYGDKARKF